MTGPPSFGILHDFRQPLPHAHGYSTYYAECLEEIEEADRLGFAAVWLSEPHVGADGFLPSPLTMAAAIAARTPRISIGTNILILPLHHPLRIAEDAAVVDLLSGGRLVLGVGQGYAAADLAAFDVDRRTRPRRLEEGIAIMRRAWDDGRTGFSGAEWQIPDAPFGPRPERRIPILIGAVAKPAVDRAVRIADGLIVYCGTPADLPARAQLLRQALAAQHRADRGFRLVAGSIMHVDEDPERAWDHAAPGIAYPEGDLSRHAGRTADTPRLTRHDVLVGTPEVAARLIALHAEARFDHFAAWTRLPGLSHEQALASMRLVAEHAVPKVTRALAGTTREPASGAP
jgi:alkanesulfonate monooxygenase SsuD/methylene tetrahydromethanopterin reductase-like flavin-dependent oxidoreductase (luciferase family)